MGGGRKRLHGRVVRQAPNEPAQLRAIEIQTGRIAGNCADRRGRFVGRRVEPPANANLRRRQRIADGG